MSNDKKITIYSQRLAGTLMARGFVLKGVENDPNGSNRNVFIFNETPEILKAMNEYMTHKR